MKELIGFKINKIEVCGEYQENIVFHVGGSYRIPAGTVVYYGYGDCCSETYFSDVLNQSNIIGKKITRVEEVELIEGDYNARKSRQEEDNVYGFKIYAGDVFCLVTMRNCSNGYYGGSCELESVKIGDAKTEPFKRIEEVVGDTWFAPEL